MILTTTTTLQNLLMILKKVLPQKERLDISLLIFFGQNANLKGEKTKKSSYAAM